jgi:flagellar basal-body rod modification protein FlgD
MTVSTIGTALTAQDKNGTVSGATSDFNLFLKLLTTQMQNQDPLKPMDSTEYTQQLAQYTQVQQTTKQTSTLQEILTQLSTQNMAQASGFIGRQASFDTPVSGLSSTGPAQWGYKTDRAITTLTATFADASGKTVATRDIAPDGLTGRVAWDGTLADGSKAADGAYTLALTGIDANGQAVPVGITSTGLVQDVVGGGAGGSVTLGVNGTQLPMDKLIRLTAS